MADPPKYQDNDLEAPPTQFRQRIYSKLPPECVRCVYSSHCRGLVPTNRTSSVLYVLGAQQETAERLIEALLKNEDNPDLRLRWWNENPPAYDSVDSFLGQWMSYNPKKRSSSGIDQNQVHDSAAHIIVVLYYRSDNDPAQLLQEAFHDQTTLLSEDLLLLPVTECLFDPKSCKSVLLSAHAPLQLIRRWQGYCFTPVSMPFIDFLSVKELKFRGGGKRSLGSLKIHHEPWTSYHTAD